MEYWFDNKRRLPILPLPGESEAISSWLARICYSNNISFTFLAEHFDIPKKYLDDPDFSNEYDISILKRELGLSNVNGPNLISLNPELKKWTENKLIRKAGIVSRKYKICPKCIGKNNQIDFKWIFSFSFICANCNSVLLDKCFKCGSEILIMKNFKLDRKLHFCFSCGCRLFNNKVIVTKNLSDIEFQNLIYSEILNTDFIDNLFIFKKIIESKSPICRDFQEYLHLKSSNNLINLQMANYILQNFPIHIIEFNLEYAYTFEDWKMYLKQSKSHNGVFNIFFTFFLRLN